MADSTNPPRGDCSRSSKTPSGSLSPHDGQYSSSWADQLLAAAALHLEHRAVKVADRVQQRVQRLDPDAEAHVVGLRELAHRDAHHPVVFVEDRAARVARVHRGVGLDVVFAVHQLLGRRHRTFGDREGHAVGIPGDVDLAADRQRVVLGERNVRQRGEIPFGRQQGDVHRRVCQHDLGQVRVALVVVDGDGAEALGHVVVRHEKVIGLEVEATARAARMGHFEYRLVNIVLFHRIYGFRAVIFVARGPVPSFFAGIPAPAACIRPCRLWPVPPASRPASARHGPAWRRPSAAPAPRRPHAAMPSSPASKSPSSAERSSSMIFSSASYRISEASSIVFPADLRERPRHDGVQVVLHVVVVSTFRRTCRGCARCCAR